MSITVAHVTKRYGAQKALDDVSFEIGAGEVVGFLGPNGAGKSTMMKVLTGFIPPSDGEASVCGHSVAGEPMAVRRCIGYLPEHTPLYTDLYVREYLEFVGGIHGVKGLKDRVKEMIAAVGLEREQHKRIGALSKGYRQRVGLAQAMIHDPEVLILDEPTSGLDPNQLAEVRGLIRDLGREKTVMLSTHIMQEVEAICDRAIIIDRGKIVADDRAERLRGMQRKREVIAVEFDDEVAMADLKDLAGVVHVQRSRTCVGALLHGEDVRAAVFQLAVDKGRKVLTLQRAERGLEDVFKELTRG